MRFTLLSAALLVLGLVPGTVTLEEKPAGAARSAAAASAPELGTGTVLFIDSHRVELIGNARRVYNPGKKYVLDAARPGRVGIGAVSNPMTDADDEQDGDIDEDGGGTLGLASVLADTRDGKPLYRMYLETWNSRVSSEPNVGYRESTDGIHWKVRQNAEGSPDWDSVVLVPNLQPMSVVRDNASGDYVLIGWDRRLERSDGSTGGYVVMTSTDGLTFTRVAASGSLSRLRGDVVQAASDPFTGRNFAVAKQKTAQGPRCGKNRYAGGRTFSTHSAIGYRTWSGPSNLLAADCVDLRGVPSVSGTVNPVHVYGISFQRYGDQFVGFPWIYRITDAGTPEQLRAGYSNGPVDSQLASTPSVTSTTWRRSDAVVPRNGTRVRPVLIARGPDGAWDDGMIYAQGPILNIEGRSWVYYTGWNEQHRPSSSRIARPGLATWRQDGFVGLRAGIPTEPALVRTRSFRLGSTAVSRDLRVNASLGSDGWMRVGVKDAATGRYIAGYHPRYSTVIRGDRLTAMVRWGGKNLGRLRGRDLKLEFRYSGKGSTFYSYRVS